MTKKYLKTGLGLVGASVMVGSMPNITGSATETNLKGNFSTGIGNVGKVLPTYGKVVATKMILKPMSKLKKVGSKVLKTKYQL